MIAGKMGGATARGLRRIPQRCRRRDLARHPSAVFVYIMSSLRLADRAEAPYYLPLGNEIDVFRACHERGLPVMLKGPTGCGKTRFVEHMAHLLGRPLVTIACHDDLSASDLTGRYLIRGGETVWIDGPLTTAVRTGAICYLDEVVEARQDTLVVIHPLTDDRRILPIEKTGELLEAAPGFQLVISYNPGYQHAIKDLKPSTRQRFVALEFDFPPAGARGGDRRARERREARDGARARRARAAGAPAARSGARRGAGHAPARLDGAVDRGRDPARARRAAPRSSRRSPTIPTCSPRSTIS